MPKSVRKPKNAPTTTEDSAARRRLLEVADRTVYAIELADQNLEMELDQPTLGELTTAVVFWKHVLRGLANDLGQEVAEYRKHTLASTVARVGV